MSKDKKIVPIDLHYNFISYPECWHYPYSSISELPKHNNKDKSFFKNSGYIEYTINTKSKLTTDFRKNKAGDIFISGSEIRGRIRSNLEILSFSYPEFVEDKRILYRGFATDNRKLKKEYSKTLGIDKNNISKVINAGYLQRIGNKYYICPAEKFYKKNFLTVEEYNLIENYKNFNLKINERMYHWDYECLKRIKQLKKHEEKLSIKIKRLRIKTGLNKDKEFNKRLKRVYCAERYSGCRWMSYKNNKERLEELSKSLKKKVFLKNDKEYIELRETYEERTKIKLEIEKIWIRIGRDEKNTEFRPFEKEICYSLNENGGINEISNPDGKHRCEMLQNGILFCSTNAGKKRRHYLINKKSSNNLIEINDKLINSYNNNLDKFKLNKNQGETIKKFYNIFNDEDDCKDKIVFYLTDNDNEITNIGRSPYMKIGYDNKIKEIIDRKNLNGENSKNHISYADSIFGFTGKGEKGRVAYKSKLRFTSAVVEKGKLLKKREEFFLPQPHASAFNMYLDQERVSNTDEIISYANHISEIKLRGYKFYKVRDKEECFRLSKFNENLKKMVTIKEVLEPESKIKGKIYFNNLAAPELGLLLMSIDASFVDEDNSEYFELIGGAKAYGYGKCQIHIDNIYLEEKNDKLDFKDLGCIECEDYFKFVKAYKNVMKKLLEENKRTIKEYKISKKILRNTEEEKHYLDYVNSPEKGKEISAYESNQVLQTILSLYDYESISEK